MELCLTCSKRDTCTSLCPEAESFVNQDFVSLQETRVAPVQNRETAAQNTAIDQIHAGSDRLTYQEVASYHNESEFNYPSLTKLENHMLHLFHHEGYSYREIARAVSGGRNRIKKNESAVKSHLWRIRRKIRNFSTIGVDGTPAKPKIIVRKAEHVHSSNTQTDSKKFDRFPKNKKSNNNRRPTYDASRS